MPVLITGATGLVGRALAARLLDEGAQVRAYLRRDDAELRAAGVHVALGEMDNVERLESALTQVHTIVHLVGSYWPARGETYDHVNRDTTESAAIAARAADVKRFIFLSFPGADATSSNEFLAAKGRAEEHVRRAGMQHAIFRCAPIAEALPRLFARLVRGPVVDVPGTGRQRVNPIPLSDVLQAIVAADSREAEVEGTWELGGAEAVTMDDCVARAVPGKRAVHLRMLSTAPKPFADLFARDIVADASAAGGHFGLTFGALP